MNDSPVLARAHFLFDNDQPQQVWSNTRDILLRISPDFDVSYIQTVFDDVVRLYRGEYPGYKKVNTLYHDLRHVMDVFMCAMRLLHGMHTAGKQLTHDEICIGAIAALFHDIGYAQQTGDDTGTGAKYTKTHVQRGVAFMKQYLSDKHWPESWKAPLECAMLCTDPSLKPSSITFPDERAHMLGMLVGTADYVGQMADRSYLEKLLFLYFEFKEAQLGDFASVQDLLVRTEEFYKITRKKLDEEFRSTYRFLGNHFREWFGEDSNYYMDSIGKNIAYLSQIVHEANGNAVFDHLKRRGIVEQAKAIEQ